MRNRKSRMSKSSEVVCQDAESPALLHQASAITKASDPVAKFKELLSGFN